MPAHGQSRLTTSDHRLSTLADQELSRHLNSNVSACEDFALHVCGRQPPAPPDATSTYHMATMQFVLGNLNHI